MSAPVSVLVFGRTPYPGAVKRRLIPALGAVGAARLYGDMLGAAVRTAVSADVGPVELWVTPTTEHPLFEAFRSRWGVNLCIQRGPDLGARMQRALEQALRNTSSSILIGSDCPSLALDDLHEAARRLRGGDAVVLGPAVDGGYYLIGLARPMPELFRNVSWGSAQVLATTRRRLKESGSRWSELSIRRDIDRPGDLEYLALLPETAV